MNPSERAGTYDSGRGTVMAWLDDDRHGALSASLTGEALSPEQVLWQFQSGSAVHRALQSLSAQRWR